MLQLKQERFQFGYEAIPHVPNQHPCLWNRKWWLEVLYFQHTGNLIDAFFHRFFYLWTKTQVSFANYRPTCAWRQQCGVTLGTSSLNCFGRPLKRFFRYQTRYRHHVSEAKSYNNEPSITYSMLVQLIDSQDDAVFKQIYFKPLTFKVLFSHNCFHNFIYF